MATYTNQVIDADAHVVETERVWDYLDASEQRYRPTLVASPDNPQRQIWMLDGENIGNKFPSPDEKQSEQHLKRFGREVGTPVEARRSCTGITAPVVQRTWDNAMSRVCDVTASTIFSGSGSTTTTFALEA